MNLMMKYHNEVWLPFSNKLDKILKKIPLLYKMKRLFDVHFKICTILGIFAVPKGDVDCYWYLWYRSNNPKYKNLKFKTRLRKVKRIIRKVIY